MAKILPIKTVAERNADLDAEIATRDNLRTLDAIADDLLDDLEMERVLRGDVDLAGEPDSR